MSDPFNFRFRVIQAIWVLPISGSRQILSHNKRIALFQSWWITLLLFWSATSLANGQIVPDNSLPVNSRVTPQGNTSQIEGGTATGSNLFHSFAEFSIPTGGTAFFNNSPNIQNIFTRVTGGSVSNIDGILRANGTANLFLLNPNGIIFGPNAQLNIGGSFLASTASSINFAGGIFFSATASTQTSPLLTVNVPIGLQFGANPNRILVQGQGQSITTTSALNDSNVGLRLQPNQTLALIGGNVALEGGILKTEGGRIELGAVGSGTVTLNQPVPTQPLTLGYEGINNFSDIQLSQFSIVDASGAGGGDIQIHGRQVTLQDKSRVVANTLGNQNGREIAIRAQQLTLRNGSLVSASTLSSGAGGNITVIAPNSVELIGNGPLELRTQLLNKTVTPDTIQNGLYTLSFGSGAAGNLTIDTGNLILRDGAAMSTATFNSGTGGNLDITAKDSVELFGSGLLAVAYGVEFPEPAGNLTINTGNLILRNGSLVSSSTFSQGRGGDLTVVARDTVELSGTPTDPRFLTSLIATSFNTGDSGNLTIYTDRLIVRDGGDVSTGTGGSGRGGDLTIVAGNSIEVSGRATNRSSVLRSDASEPNKNIIVSVIGKEIPLTGGAGKLSVETGQLIVRDGGRVTVSNQGSGNAGQLTIKAGSILLDDFGSITATTKLGNSRGIDIQTQHLNISNNSFVSASTVGAGDGGNISVEASDSVEIIGNGNFKFRTDLLSGAVEPDNIQNGIYTLSFGSGKAGNLTIETGRLILRDGASVSASTFNAGDGGNLAVVTRDSVELFESGLVTSSVDPKSKGAAGDISVDTQNLLIEDGAIISASTFGQGGAGKVEVNASDSVALSGASPDGVFSSAMIASTFNTGTAGDLIINTGKLMVGEGAFVSVSTFGPGKGGNLAVVARDSVEVSGRQVNGDRPSSAIRSDARESPPNIAGRLFGQVPPLAGEAGNLSIETGQLTVRDGGEVSVSNAGSGNAGQLTIAADSIFISNSGAIAATTKATNGGNITLFASDSLLLRGNSNISTNAGTDKAGGDGGNINISTNILTALENSDITANAYQGRGGRVEIKAQAIFGTEGRTTETKQSDITATSERGPQFSGTVEIQTPNLDPSQGLVSLPEQVVDVSTLVAQGCKEGSQASQLVVTGRSGLPPTPRESLSSNAVWVDLRGVGSRSEVESSRKGSSLTTDYRLSTSPVQIVEAQGWVINSKGEVVLTASAPNATPHSPWIESAKCPAR